MGLISLPIMLRYGYDRRWPPGSSRVGHAGADHPALAGADHHGRPARPSVGDMYKGAFVPGFVLTGLYMAYVLGCSGRPNGRRRLPPAARSSANQRRFRSRRCLAAGAHGRFGSGGNARAFKRARADKPTDELIVIGMSSASASPSAGPVVNRGALGLSHGGEGRFVLIPPLALIFLVLGTIFLGIATPTEGRRHGRRRGADHGGDGAATPQLDPAQTGDGQHGQAHPPSSSSSSSAHACSRLTFYGVDGPSGSSTC